WLICPYEKRFQFQRHIIDPWPSPSNLSAMPEESKALLLYEITWHHQITFKVTPSWMVKEMLAVCDPDKPCIISKKQQLEIALLILKNSRWMDSSESEKFFSDSERYFRKRAKILARKQQ
ncbi:SIR2 family protein, partial [Pseudomonas syringae]